MARLLSGPEQRIELYGSCRSPQENVTVPKVPWNEACFVTGVVCETNEQAHFLNLGRGNKRVRDAVVRSSLKNGLEFQLADFVKTARVRKTRIVPEGFTLNHPSDLARRKSTCSSCARSNFAQAAE